MSQDDTVAKMNVGKDVDLPLTVKGKKSNHQSFSATAIAAYFSVFVLIISLVSISYQAPKEQSSLANVSPLAAGSTTQSTSSAAVDKVTAASIGATIAESADIPVSRNVANLSTSLTIESLLAQNDTNTISKPQIVQPSADSRDIVKYTSVAGDTAESVAAKYGVSAQTLKWANNLSADTINPGTALSIPPIDGILYTVKSGDTLDSLAAKYKADRNYIMSFNDLELSGNPPVGAQIVIPAGQLPAEEQPGYVAPRRSYVASSGASSAPSQSFAGVNYGSYGSGSSWKSAYGWSGPTSPGNLYVYGQCTFYAYERRAQLGNPIGGQWGNATSWAYSGASAGFLVDRNPTPGAIIQNGGGYGHVAVVESVEPGVAIYISEMNGYRWGGGWNRVGFGVISWSEAVSGMYNFIH